MNIGQKDLWTHIERKLGFGRTAFDGVEVLRKEGQKVEVFRLSSLSVEVLSASAGKSGCNCDHWSFGETFGVSVWQRQAIPGACLRKPRDRAPGPTTGGPPRIRAWRSQVWRPAGESVERGEKVRSVVNPTGFDSTKY